MSGFKKEGVNLFSEGRVVASSCVCLSEGGIGVSNPPLGSPCTRAGLFSVVI